MTTDEFNKIVQEQMDICAKVLMNKAQEYATEDRLHNFKIAAALQNQTPKEALAGMLAKHTVSIFDMCRCPADLPPFLWDEKITDHINYLLLLKAVVTEAYKKPLAENT